MTSLVYQLEWSSHFVRSHPSKDSLTYKLAVYRCLSSFLDATAQVSSPSLFRLTSRIIFEACSDISLAAKVGATQSLMANTDVGNYELHVCCAIASIRLIELLFINHSFVLSQSLAQITEYPARPNNDFCDYKVKQALLTLSSELHHLAMRLVALLSKTNNLTPLEQILVKPHFLVPFLNAASAVQDYGFLFPKSGALHKLSRVLLRHNDSLVRISTERCFRYTFKPPSDLTFAKSSLFDSNSLVSSFTQTEQSSESIVSTQENDSATPLEATQEQTQLAHEPAFANAVLAPSNCVLTARVETAGTNTFEAPLQEMDKSSVLLEETTLFEASAPSKGVKRHANLEDPPIPAKKTSLGTMTYTTDVEETTVPEAYPQKPVAPEGGSLSVQDVLCTFDDTLI
ncbi:hypothetical protein TcWFU_000786 [Taenia crassiceps]|uniref:DUF5742 domain-containing protein n=1 Tax=Taenia crassiceps TaxID=6207 RepID=A0ABR4QNG2_9CEST